jgi:hypothetical protein
MRGFLFTPLLPVILHTRARALPSSCGRMWYVQTGRLGARTEPTKKARRTSFIYGPSGIGKTRACLELIGHLRWMEGNSPGDLEQREDLKQRLASARLVIIDLKHNGEKYVPYREEGFRAEVSLVLRLCHQLWFPDAPFSQIVDIARGIANTMGMGMAHETFTLQRVFTELR